MSAPAPPAPFTDARRSHATRPGGASPAVAPPAADALSPVPLVAAAVLVAVAAFGFSPVFAGSLAGLVLPAVVVPVVLVALLCRGSLPLSALVSLLAFLVVATAVVDRSAPTPAALRELLDSAVNGWARVLDTTTPMPQRPELVALVPLLVWLASYVTAELVVRSRSRLLLVVPALLLFGVALVFAGGAGSSLVQVGTAAVFLVAAALVLASRSGPGTSGAAPAARHLSLGALVLLPVVLLASGLGGSIAQPSRQPFDLRQHRTAALDREEGQNPLDLISAWSGNPNDTLFSVTTTSPQNWRLVVLDDFDGTTWGSNAHYSPAGLDLEPGRVPGATQPVDQRVVLQDLPGLWLPAADRPVRLTGARADVDLGTGALVSVDPLRPGLSYRVRSEVPRRSPAQLVGAQPANDADARAHLVLPPGLPSDVKRAANTAVGSATLPVQKALLLEQYLRTGFKFDPKAAPGHSYAHLRFFLTSSQAGTSEQFATAFAVMARSLGLPSRVVVGFTSGSDDGHPGTYDVHSGDVLAWPEVDFAGLGWVPFYPTPTKGSAGASKTPAGQSSEQAVLAQQVSQAIDRKASTTPGSPSAPGGNGHGTEITVAVVVLAVLVLAWGSLAALAVRRRRRRRLTSAAAGLRVAAAWRQAMETLEAAGYPDARSLTAERAAGVAGLLAPGSGAATELQELGRLADRALYSPGHVADGEAIRAWELADGIAGAMRPQIPRARRVQAALALNR